MKSAEMCFSLRRHDDNVKIDFITKLQILFPDQGISD